VEETRQHLVTTPDGRCLAVKDAGVPDGQALVTHHGTPGAGLLFGAERAQTLPA
jgi:hypothetical protein